MADALGRPITACVEPEPSCRGAALWAMERAGIIKNIADLPASLGGVFEPRSEHRDTYARLRDAQHDLYKKLYGSSS
jgi:sugar (pentulose or hexulose) kinase